MKLKIQKNVKTELLTALLLNGIFLFVLLQFYKPYFETNDDFIFKHLCDGTYGFYEYRLMFMNAVLGLVFKTLYFLIPALPWYSLIQFFCIFLSFTIVIWVLIHRWNIVPALGVSLAVLCIFGLDAYICMQFTKVASLLTAAGLLLMFCAFGENEQPKKIMLTFGAIIALLGLLYRPEQFLVCGGICAFAFFDYFLPLCKQTRSKKNLIDVLVCIKPFVIVGAAALLLFAVDKLHYIDEDWSFYLDYNNSRSNAIDFYGIPDYQDAAEIMQKHGISETMLALTNNWDFLDTDIMDTEAFREIAEFSESQKSGKASIFPVLLSNLREMASLWPAYGLILVCVVWLIFGRHDKLAWVSVISAGMMFVIAKLGLIYMGRYNMYRVDYGMIFALMLAVLWFIPRRCSKKRAAAITITSLLLTAMIMFIYLPGWNAKFVKASSEDFSAQKGYIESLSLSEKLSIADTFLADYYILESPFAVEPEATAANLVYLGGWQAMYPPLMDVFASYGVENPYRDCVDNDRVQLVTTHIDLTLAHIRQEYCPSAEAITISSPSDEIPYGVYMVVS